MTPSNTDLFGDPVVARVSASTQKPSSIARRSLLDELIQPGRFVMKRAKCYCIYEGKMVPVLVISSAVFKKIDPVLKRVKGGKMVLSLLAVRRQHGNSEFKKRYKALRAINNEKSTHHGTRCQAPQPGIQIQKGWNGSHPS